MNKKSIAILFIMVLNLTFIYASNDLRLFNLNSPNNKISITISYDKTEKNVSYSVISNSKKIFVDSPLGITTNKVDFISGLTFINEKSVTIDETYTLPHGKVSTYHNNANEKTLSFEKDGGKLNIIFRAYNDGIAFRYQILGSGDIEILKENSGFKFSTGPVYWGQSHPNYYGNETPLSKLRKNCNSFSLSLLCNMKRIKHWIYLSQAATYGTYCIPHLDRDKTDKNLLKFTFPLQQVDPVKTILPFLSPWRVAVISPKDLSVVVEQTMFENLNPPTDPKLKNADWIKPGRSTFDWFAGDRKNWKGWVDFNSEMGWEYHLVDDGWEGYIKDPAATVAYGKSKNVGIMVWRSTPSVNSAEKIEKVFKEYNKLGISGVKVDFFDRLPNGITGVPHNDPRVADYEDTQMAIQLRDDLALTAMKYKLQLIFHGAAIPTGERRRWPHILGTEGVRGQEAHPKVKNDNCIAFIRNPVGSTDYSPVWFGRDKKTDAYQLATSVVFESGLLIFADLHKNYLNHISKEFLKELPSSWDEIKLLKGKPAYYTVIARRKGKTWFVGGISSLKKTYDINFDFLAKDTLYLATIYRDQKSGDKLTIETKKVDKNDTLQINTLKRGGFAITLKPIDDVKHKTTEKAKDVEAAKTIETVKDVKESTLKKATVDWDTMAAQWKTPEWFKDAKFGIWLHWGPQSIPRMGGGWYAKHMYQPKNTLGRETWGENSYKYHNKKYGHPSVFGYKDICNLWKAEYFDADTIVDQFQKWGAKYVAVMGVHHDNFDLFYTKDHPWNSVNIGPKQDIVGNFVKAARKRALPVTVSVHNARSRTWLIPTAGSDKKGKFKGVPYDGNLNIEDGVGTWWEGMDPHLLYANRLSESEFKKSFKTRLTALIANYQPDMIYFDDAYIPLGDAGKEPCALLYQNSLKKHGKIEAIITVKRAEEGTLLDAEKGETNKIHENTFQKDTTLDSAWFYKEDYGTSLYHNTRSLTETLVDTVSKNGVLLLNVAVLGNGKIPQRQKNVMNKLASWLKANGESIYGTRPWLTFGQGGTMKIKLYKERSATSKAWDHSVVRYTKRGDKIVYAFIFGKPRGKEILLSAFAENNVASGIKIKAIKMLYNNESIEWSQDKAGISVKIPKVLKYKYCQVLKLEVK